MQGLKMVFGGAALCICAAGLAFAAGHSDPKMVTENRVMVMKTMGKNLGILGKMAKGEMAYDAAAASAAAAELLVAAKTDPATLWIEGTSNFDYAETRAQPNIWDNMDDINKKSADLVSASMAMEAAAGTDLAALQGAMGALGGACGACHKVYRAPES